MATPLDLHCWNCGCLLRGVPLPVGRRENCPHCDASLRACRQCRFFDTSAAKSCREPVADEVTDKEAGNFCDFYQPLDQQGGSASGEADRARAKLTTLFGGEPLPHKSDGTARSDSIPSDASPRPAPSGDASSGDAAAEARAKLDALFGKKDG